MFAAIGRFSYRFRWPVVVVWAVLFVLGLAAASHLSHELKGGGFSDPKAPAQRALAVLNQRLHTGLSTLTVVFSSPTLQARSAEFLALEERALAEVTPRTVPHLQAVQTFASSQQQSLVSRDGRASLAVLVFDVPLEEVQKEVPAVRAAIVPTALSRYVTGEPAVYADIETLSATDLRRAESYALPFALLVLLLVFGSVVAAALPLIGGGFAVATTLGVVWVLAQHVTMSIFVMNVASLLGLAVGIDYSLFIVGRFREELAGGATVADAVEQTVAHAGRSIFFSGVAVVVGLLGLVSFQYMSLRSIGIGGSIVVLFSVAAALTLLPAVLGILGQRVDALRVLGRRGHEGAFWRRWSDAVMRHPWTVVVFTVAVIFAFSGPVLKMKVNVPTATELPTSVEARQGYDILQARFDRGQLSPVNALLTWGGPDTNALSPSNLSGLYAYGRRLAALPGVESVFSVVNMTGFETLRQLQAFWQQVQSLPLGAGTATRQVAAAKQLAATTTAPGTALFNVAAASDPSESAAQSLANTIRTLAVPPGAVVHVAGLSAGVRDFVHALYGRFPWVILYTFVVTYLVLLLLLRSVWLPLKAIIVNTLSLLSSFGALVFVFQDGHFQSILGFQSAGVVDATLPVLMFCTIFGISMDYEVFLLTRMREEWLLSGDNRRSVGFGLARTGRIITSAALIIVIVAGSFAFTQILVTKAIGVGLAVAIALDATIIRVLLVPASMRILGRVNWWCPRWLERILPRVGEA